MGSFKNGLVLKSLGNRQTEGDLKIVKEMRKSGPVILLLWLAVLLNGCSTGPSTQNVVVTDYLLTDAGFAKLDVNDTTPHRQALLNATIKGQFIAYRTGDNWYYVYGDESSNALYLGDEAAYQRYLAKTQDKRVCQTLDASQGTAFWSCFQEFQKKERP